MADGIDRVIYTMFLEKRQEMGETKIASGFIIMYICIHESKCARKHYDPDEPCYDESMDRGR